MLCTVLGDAAGHVRGLGGRGRGHERSRILIKAANVLKRIEAMHMSTPTWQIFPKHLSILAKRTRRRERKLSKLLRFQSGGDRAGQE